MSDLNRVRDLYHKSVAAFIQRDPDTEKPLWSPRADVPGVGDGRLNKQVAQKRRGHGQNISQLVFSLAPTQTEDSHGGGT
ncbi:hypothetical protein ABZV67_46200 [Streptomyces sp. NPDC005065]|uniref:hypothetical protein n=1 Tax=Streptomyces sp. NPDC005065 TaxID=3154461 RepID=UPI0033B5C44B